MPGGDGTGPMGMGPGTGWGRGGCVPVGRGRMIGGLGFGRGREFGSRRFFSAPSVAEEVEYLKEERDALNERLAELEKTVKEKK